LASRYLLGVVDDVLMTPPAFGRTATVRILTLAR